MSETPQMKTAKEVITEWGQIYRWDGGDAHKEAAEDADALIVELRAAGYVITLAEEIERLRTALEHHATHDPECEIYMADENKRKCTCGLTMSETPRADARNVEPEMTRTEILLRVRNAKPRSV